MKVKNIIFIVIPILIISFSGCKAYEETGTETTPAKDSPGAEENGVEEQIIIEEPEEIEPEVKTDELKKELNGILLDFIDASKKDEEYSFFSSKTKEMVGTEEEYKAGAKSDIFFILKESLSNINRVVPERVTYYGQRAILTVRMDRTVEGMEYQGEEVKYKFVWEEEKWKIDAYHPVEIQIMPLEKNLAGSSFEFSILVKSFFPIKSIRVAKDGELIEEESYIDTDKFEINYSNTISMESSDSLTITVEDKAGRLEEYQLSKNN
ncbi:MAG: hypothetical protein R6U35_04110 [Candidatus Humimicrobiaceae bacterium]